MQRFTIMSNAKVEINIKLHKMFHNFFPKKHIKRAYSQ